MLVSLSAIVGVNELYEMSRMERNTLHKWIPNKIQHGNVYNAKGQYAAITTGKIIVPYKNQYQAN